MGGHQNQSKHTKPQALPGAENKKAKRGSQIARFNPTGFSLATRGPKRNKKTTDPGHNLMYILILSRGADMRDTYAFWDVTVFHDCGG